MTSRKRRRRIEDDAEQDLLAGGRTFAAGELVRARVDAVYHSVGDRERWVLQGGRDEMSPTRLSKAANSWSLGELVRTGALPDGGNVESTGKTW